MRAPAPRSRGRIIVHDVHLEQRARAALSELAARTGYAVRDGRLVTR